MNEWQRMAREEGHMRGLPESPDAQKIKKSEDRLQAVLAAIMDGPKTPSQLEAKTGIDVQSVRCALSGLIRDGIIDRKKDAGTAYVYSMVNKAEPEPVADKYPNTFTILRRHSNEANGLGYKPPMAIRLPAAPFDMGDLSREARQ